MIEKDWKKGLKCGEAFLYLHKLGRKVPKISGHGITEMAARSALTMEEILLNCPPRVLLTIHEKLT